MKRTSIYKLNQWEKSDRIMMEDFNADNLKVEGALAGLAEADQARRDEIVALTAAMALKGNCQLWTTSYVGDMNSTNITITFPKKPTLVCILGPEGYTLVTIPGVTRLFVNPSSVYDFSATWTETSMSWNPDKHGSDRLNGNGYTYQVVALIPTDQGTMGG